MLPDGMNTYTGIAVAVLATVLHLAGWHLVPGASDQVQSALLDLLTLIGSAYATYGRLRASVPGWLVKDAPAPATPPVPPAL